MIKIKPMRSYKVFLNYLARILPVFIIPLLVLIIVYFSSNQVINQQTYERNLAILQNSADTIEKTFKNMDNLMAFLDRNTLLNNFLNFVDPVNVGSTTIDLLNAQNDLNSLTTANDIITNIQVYSLKNNILIDSMTSGLYLDRYYAYENIQDVSFEGWQKQFLKTPHKYQIYPNLEISIGGRIKKSIVYANSLPITENTDIKGAVFVYLDEDYLLSQYSKIPYGDTGFIYILDNTGSVILYDNKSGLKNPMADPKQFINQSGYFSQNIGGKDMFITYYKDVKKNWVYIAALPKSQVLAPTADIRLSIELLILFTILSGCFLVYSSVSKLSKPISHVFALFAKKDKNLTYSDFEFEISKIVENNEKMQEALNNQIPELKTSIFYNFLIGEYYDADEIRQNLSKINIMLDAKHYVLLIVSVNELDTNAKLEEISAQKIYINGILAQYFENIQGIYNLDFQRTVLLLSFDDQRQDTILEKVERTAKNVIEVFSTSIQMSVSFAGDITDDVVKVQRSFLNAYSAINYKQKNPFSTIQWYIKAVQIEKTNFYYPIEQESQMITMVSSGNTTKLSEIINNIEQQNKHIFTREYSPVFYNFLLSMNSTLIRIFNESRNLPPKVVQSGAKIASKLETKEDLQKVYYLLKEVFLTIALCNKDERRQDSTSQQSRIQQYIDEHYTDPQMSLTTVADVFNITEVYLSQQFKHITGENFSKYVEKLRLGKANMLLEQGFKINEVAQMSGYNSPHVFRRAYKRIFGVVPSEVAVQAGPPEDTSNR